MKKRGRRIRRIRQLIVVQIGKRPSVGKNGRGISVSREYRVHPRGRNVHPKLVCIGIVVGRDICAHPDTGVIVDMEDDDATAGELGIPFLLLPVLYDIVFILISIVADKVSL